jgi:hypothetical protein
VQASVILELVVEMIGVGGIGRTPLVRIEPSELAGRSCPLDPHADIEAH